jgi:hypothetical protein
MASLAILLYPDWQPQKVACLPGWSSGLTVHPGMSWLQSNLQPGAAQYAQVPLAMESR